MTTLHQRIAIRAGLAAALLSGCGTFTVLDPNNPSENDLLTNPTPSKVSVAGTGLFAAVRAGVTGEIWLIGSWGREGVNLLGNNQPDYQEPYIGPIQQQRPTAWTNEYAAIRSANVFLIALDRVGQLSAEEKAAGVGLAQTLKGLSFLKIIAVRGHLGAPVEVGRSLSEDPAPFLTEDGVYLYIRALLDSAAANLQAAGGANFPLVIPDGFSSFSTPATFVQFTNALSAKAEVFHGSIGCGAPCYQLAITKLSQSFLTLDPSQLDLGPAYDFSNNPGDTPNGLSDPLNGAGFFALTLNRTDAQHQPGGALDQRVLDKIADATRDPPQTVGGFPIVGDLKFVNFFSSGRADPAHSIPILKNEELILLRAEANLGLGNKAQAISDLDFIRTNSGGLAPTSLNAASSSSALLDELLYNRRFSLLWEQGARWIDARRYNLLGTIPVVVPDGAVPTEIPIPEAECQARNLSVPCHPAGT
jgi:starch-binding outer membrane protein, SusD/RagB family